MLCLFKGEKITNPELIRFSYQVKMFQAMQNLVDEESLCLPPLYTRILAQWKKLGLTPGELKPSLPAVVPSVQFLGKPGFYDFPQVPVTTLTAGLSPLTELPGGIQVSSALTWTLRKPGTYCGVITGCGSRQTPGP